MSASVNEDRPDPRTVIRDMWNTRATLRAIGSRVGLSAQAVAQAAQAMKLPARSFKPHSVVVAGAHIHPSRVAAGALPLRAGHPIICGLIGIAPFSGRTTLGVVR